MKTPNAFATSVILLVAAIAGAQQNPQPQLKVDYSNRTLTVTATDSVSVEPEVAILHIGFTTPPTDAQNARVNGARTSNVIIAALKQAGIAETAIRSESQYLDRDYTTSHKFRLTQQWTVRTTPDRAAEILDIAISSGATSSGDIEWTVNDEKALEELALSRAAARAKQNAAVLAKGMGVRLGALIYTGNQLSSPLIPRPMIASLAKAKDVAAPLSIEPHKVLREATVYAVFAIE